MADNLTHSWSDSWESSSGGTDEYTWTVNFSTINTKANEKIPPHSKITAASLYVDAYHNIDSLLGTVKGKHRVRLVDNSNNNVLSLVENDSAQWKPMHIYNTIDLLAKNAIKSESPESGYISYGSASKLWFYSQYSYVWNHWFGFYPKLTWTYNEPRAIVSVSKSGEGTVKVFNNSGAEVASGSTHHYNNKYTIKAEAASGYHFVKWSDDNTNDSRTFTVNDSLITAYETSKSYQAVFEKHNYSTVTSETAATCLTSGSRTKKCSCGATTTETISALGHSFGSTTAAKASTCTTAGNSAYKKCSRCNLYFAGSAATNATGGKSDTSSFTIAKKSHSYTGAIKSDGNGKDATHSFKCVNGCNQYGGAVKHTWNSGSVTKQPTCTATGERTYTCTASGCGATYTEQINKLEHLYSKQEVTDPTESSAGYTTHICELCGHSYTDNYKYYIIFKNDDGSTLENIIVNHGNTPQCSKTPTKESTAEFDYTFSGWYPTPTTATSNQIYTPIFSETKRKYYCQYGTGGEYSEMGFVSGADNESYQEYGTILTLNATPNVGYSVDYWMILNEDDIDAPYEYIRNTNQISIVVNNSMLIIAYFKRLSYTISFISDDGTILKKQTLFYGEIPITPTPPIKENTAQHRYSFDGWYDTNGNKLESNTAVTKSVDYIARFNSEVQKYTIRWFNYDGQLLEIDTDVPYGTTPRFDGDTPVREGNAEHSYEFAGWNYDTENGITPSLGTVYIDITAKFTEVDNTYTVVWQHFDGKKIVVLETDEWVPYGEKPDFNGTNPTRVSDVQYDYTFIGWSTEVKDPVLDDTDYPDDTELPIVRGNVTYTAVYSATIKLYTVTVITPTSRETNVIEYGRSFTFNANQIEGYKFVKWNDGNIDNPRTIIVTEEATYTATYEILKFDIVWKDSDKNGTILEIDKSVPYGTIPEYNGVTPFKQSTAKYTYTFIGWDKEISNVTKNETYIAVYKEVINTYLVEGTVDRGGIVTGSGVFEYGTTVTLTATPLPGYRFIKWHDGDTSKTKTIVVTGEVSYLAIFIAQNIYRGNTIFVNPYLGNNPHIAVYKGLRKIYG